ncbi:MAG: hypothetical protein RSE62_03535 [Citrobacter sp.]
MQTFNIIYRISALAPGVSNTKPQAAIVVAMGLPDARRIIADDAGHAARHITIMHNKTISHGECMAVTVCQPGDNPNPARIQ